MYITGLYVFESFRGKGFARRALYVVAQQSLVLGITRLTLDDMSDNYRNGHNIYRKVGFNYLSDNGCDMSARASTVSRKAKSFLEN